MAVYAMLRSRSLIAMLLAAGCSAGLSRPLSAQTNATVTSPVLTLLETDEEEIDTALEDKQPGAATQEVYLPSNASVSTMGSNSFIRNPGIWIGPKVDLSAISAYSDKPNSFGTKFAITAISPLHCIAAAHVSMHAGDHFDFVGSDNVTVMRTIVATANPVDDITIALLNQPLPPSVRPMAILPRNWSDYLRPGIDLEMPAIFINQHNRLYLAEVEGITRGPSPMVVYHFPSGLVRQLFNIQIISGDSSFPEMVLVHGQPALLSLWHFGGYGAGPLEAAHYDAINAAMKKLSRQFGWPAKYQLRPINLQGIARVH
jgi:hypothetical protein